MPAPIDLRPLRDFIEDLFYDERKFTAKEIAGFLNQELRSRGQKTVTERTLKTNFAAWNLSRQSGLNEIREEVIAILNSSASVSSTLDQVNNALTARGKGTISERTLYNYMTLWGVARQPRTYTSPELIERIRFYFYTYGFNDRSILRDLEAKDGLTASLSGIKKIRLENGMKRRFRTTEERTAALEAAMEFIQRDIQQTPAILGFGRGYLYNYVRLKGGVLVSQNRLYDFYRTVFPDEVQKRREGNFKHRTNFTVPGPNFLWSLDGYDKLKQFGFQIYACIDAYSRCVIWFYIGRSATTALCTLKQFLRTVQHLGMRPFFTRSDHGIETPLWVAAQATLARAGPADITFEDEAGVTHRYRQGDRIESCHMYGPSTRNIRIESWWRRLRSGATDRWIVSIKRCGLQHLQLALQISCIDNFCLFIYWVLLMN